MNIPGYSFSFSPGKLFSFLILFQSTVAFGQEAEVSPANDSSNSEQLIEKVYLHTDRTWYYPGDDVWFSAYLVDAYYNTLSGNSRNLHVELISPANDIMESRTVRMDEGLGSGDFSLPASLPAGSYRIRAYTNYMRNFSDQLFFNKEIYVIHPSSGVESASVETKEDQLKVYVTFFPEGGSLVEGVSTIVAFKAVDQKGRGVDVEGSVYSSAGDLVTMFRSLHAGMGSFAIRPEEGLSYYAILRGPGNSEATADLPESFSSGVTLNVSEKDENNLLVRVRTNEHTLSGMKDDDLKLIISVRKEIIKTVMIRISSISSTLTLPTDDLPDGIIMLTLATSGDIPLAERLIFLQHKRDLSMDIKTEKEIYGKRDPVRVSIEITGDGENQETAFLSLSATEGIYSDSPAEYKTTISSWFLLESDVRGPVEGPSYYFDQSNPDRFRDLDLLLRTQGWRDFSWKFDTSRYYLPESGFQISGHVRRKAREEPLPDSRVQLMIFSGGSMIAETVPVNPAGDFFLGNIDINDIASLRASAVNRKDQQSGILTLDTAGYRPAAISGFIPAPAYSARKAEQGQVSGAVVMNNEAEMQRNWEARESARKKYSLSDTVEIGEIVVTARKPPDMQTRRVISARMTYGEPDNELVVTPDLETVPAAPVLLMGTVPGVMVTGPGFGGTYKIRVRTGIYSNKDPILLVDGLEMPLEVLNWLPVASIDRIDVLKSIGKTAVFGLRGNFGVISVITRVGNRRQDASSENPSVVNTLIRGYNSPRIFYSPRHDSAEDQGEPDLRTTLFWKPDIKLQLNRKLQLDYFNADNASTIRITAEGITSTGIPVTGTAEYEVKE